MRTYDFVLFDESVVYGTILAKDWHDLERKMRAWHPHQWAAKERIATPRAIRRETKVSARTG